MRERLLQFFSFAHLPARLAAVSRPFHEVAHAMCDVLPPNPERTVMLRKLLEAKDCAVRAALYEAPAEPTQA
jgi:ferritin-like protein